MTAQEAKKLADSKKKDLNDVLKSIKSAAERGEYGIVIATTDLIDPENTISSLKELGYTVTNGAIKGNLKILWV